MIESLPNNAKYLVYEALIHAIDTNSGIGFHNADQGHPAYRVGADGKIDESAWGDSPDKNHLYRLLRELSMYFVKHEEERPSSGPLILTWEDFCRRAIQAYEEKKRA